jgi:hypothetical protein
MLWRMLFYAWVPKWLALADTTNTLRTLGPGALVDHPSRRTAGSGFRVVSHCS